MKIQRYNKAILAVGVPLLFIVLGQFGLSPDSTIKDAVVMILTGLGVYMVPNRG